ncbi:IS1595 family transposase [Phenylobacterium sp. LjRoot225]|uniref:IS1595 family transposase n=1 Tax=Phenylobacterium sp. LjRoot225 TaxID=3342285 RepID=UPI003F4FBC63
MCAAGAEGAADPMEGVLEVDGFYFGGRRPRDPDRPHSGRGGKGLPRTSKTSALAMVERPQSREPGAPAGRAGAAVIEDLSANEAERVLEAAAACEDTHLMTDEWKAFAPLGAAGFCAHDTVRHSVSEYARGIVHTNSAEGFNNRVRRTIAGVFHHISPKHADLHFHEIGFRWSQRVVAGQTVRRSRKGRETAQTVWTRVAPALQLPAVLAHAVGRQMRRTKDGGISIQSSIAVFG